MHTGRHVQYYLVATTFSKPTSPQAQYSTIRMFHAAQLTRKHLVSPSVMLLELNVPSLQTFHPGQWVDFVVPECDWVGGFSIASSPIILPKVHLAIKKSNAIPSSWVHRDAVVGAEINVRVGGSCTLKEEENDIHKPAIFCAGGIGISPMIGVYRQYLALRRRKQVNTPQAMFLYSVSSEEELVFGTELLALFNNKSEGTRTRTDHMCEATDRMVFTLTQEQWNLERNVLIFGGKDNENTNGIELKTGRILKSFLDDAPKDGTFYICGPPAMNDDAVSHLKEKGITSDRIRYEKWW